MLFDSSFEFDQAKSDANLEKHGIDFFEAQEIWDDPYMIAVRSDRSGEVRYVGIGRIMGACWTVVYTLRGDAVRIISARKSTVEEGASYDKANQ